MEDLKDDELIEAKEVDHTFMCSCETKSLLLLLNQIDKLEREHCKIHRGIRGVGRHAASSHMCPLEFIA